MSKTTPLGTRIISMEEIDAVYAKARVERSNAIRQLIAAPIARGVKSVWNALTGRLDHSEKTNCHRPGLTSLHPTAGQLSQ